MSSAQKKDEPRMEEILLSIRRILAEEDQDKDQTFVEGLRSDKTIDPANTEAVLTSAEVEALLRPPEDLPTGDSIVLGSDISSVSSIFQEISSDAKINAHNIADLSHEMAQLKKAYEDFLVEIDTAVSSINRSFESHWKRGRSSD